MSDHRDVVRKSPLSFLFFVVPAIGILIVGIFLALNNDVRGADILQDGTVLVCFVLGMIATIWGLVFVRRPVVTLTSGAVVLPNGTVIEWSQIKDAQEGQETTLTPSQSAGARQVTHEVVRFFHHDGAVTKIVTTWAKVGPQAANDKILSAFAQSRSETPD